MKKLSVMAIMVCTLAMVLMFASASTMDTTTPTTYSYTADTIMDRIIDSVESLQDRQLLSMDNTTDEVAESAPEYIEHVVSAGDSFWAIADTYYGDGTKYGYVMAANDVTTIHPGDIVKIYDPEEYEIEDTMVDEYVEKIETEIQSPSSTANATISYNNEPAPISGSSDGTKPDWTTYRDTTAYDTSNMTYVGEYKITGYDPHCAHCCGKTDGYTAAGTQAILGYSAGSNSLPLGTVVYIEGYGIFRIDDCGGSSKNLIDIACDSHDICYHMTGRANVYIVN